MNQIHEQCPKIDSETVPSQTGSKTGSELNQVHNAPAWPSLRAQAAPKPRAHGRVVGVAAVSWPWPPTVSQGVMAVSWRVLRALAPCRSAQVHVLAPCRKTLPCWPGSLCHDTKPSLATQFPTSLATSVTIQTLYRDTAFCLTNLSQSQYKQCIAIHFLLSLSTTCHDTIWIVS